MKEIRGQLLAATILLLGMCPCPYAQQPANSAEFGPVVRAYLGYLKNEQEVVDDRVSRHEVSPKYYRRNSNRIRALRQVAIRIATETRNDYLPELEAVARDEFGTLFEDPPDPQTLKIGQVFRDTFRFLGTVRSVEVFYVFARLDPYEQADLMEKKGQTKPMLNRPISGTQQNSVPRRELRINTSQANQP